MFCGRDRRVTTGIARSCPLPYATTVVREVKGKEVVHHLEYGFREVRLPEHPTVPLCLVVVTGFGEEPMMLITNAPQRKNRNVLWRTVSSYITRWRIEETIRFGKQSYGLEDVRVLTYERLRNMMVLVPAAMFFAAVVLGTKTKLEILVSHVYRAAKRFFGIPNFRYYAIADGVGTILTRHPRRLSMPTDEPTDQPALFTT